MDRSQAQNTAKQAQSLSILVSRIIPASLFALCGYLLSACALPFGVYPLGLALLAAADKNAIFIYAGLILGTVNTLDDGPTVTIFVGIYTLLLLMRILVRLTLDPRFSRSEGKKSIGELTDSFFGEQVGYRVCAAALASFALSFSKLIGSGFLYYDLFGLILSVVICPIAAYIFYGYFARREQTRAQAYLSSLGLIALLTAALYAASSVKIYGVSLAVGGGLLSVLLVCRRRGFLCGLLLSVALGLTYSPTLCPIFIICAFSYGIFARISTTLISLSALFGSLAYAFYAKGIYALDGISGGVICACVLFSVVVKLQSLDKSGEDGRVEKIRCRVLNESELDSVRLFDMNRLMSSMSEGFANLSQLFEEMKVKFPRKAELRSICEQAFERSCTGCPEYSKCRFGGYLDREANKLSACLDEKGALRVADFDGELSARCSRLLDIIDEINYSFEMRFERRDCRASENDVFAQDRNYGYKAFSRLLSESMEKDTAEYVPDLEASARLCEPLEALDIGIVGVIVYGSRRKRIYAKAKDRRLLEDNCEQICRAVRAAIGIELDEKHPILGRCTANGEGSIELCQKACLSVSCVTQSSAASDESFCGDSLCTFESSEGRFFAALSDGMGSGRDAALMSSLTTGFIKNMLVSAAMSNEILSMLNAFLHSRSGSSVNECSATLDLMELDEISGCATFFKCGAAPTYVYRNNSLFKLRSRTMPLGILPDPDAKILEFNLSDGDIVVMMSDGVTAGKEDCPYLFDLLKQNIDTAGSARTADLIMKYAKGNGSGDDITVAIMKVSRV